MDISNGFLVEKRNVLNEIRSNNLTLQELRFFSIYLAKINARDVSTRVVRFSLTDFQNIMDLAKVDIRYISNVVDGLLCKVVRIRLDSGGFESFQLFKECRVDKNESGEWYIEIDAHDKALPLMFDYKERYFTYELWNALRVKSANQLRMYEILKQYEWVKMRTISIVDLKELLGLNASDYPRYGDFKTRVLDGCQKALEEYTDIKFTYEPTGKLGRGGKIKSLKFIISHNDKHKDQLSLYEYIDKQEVAFGMFGTGEDDEDLENEHITFMSEACENEFNGAEIQVLYNLITKIITYTSRKNVRLEMYDYLKRKYDELKWRSSRTGIKNRFGYLKKIIEADMEIENES